eukprot:5583522-Pleurochrysis_carterae.AAC.4
MAQLHWPRRESVAREHHPCSACKAMMQIMTTEGASLQRRKLSAGRLLRPRKQAARRPAKQSYHSISSACGGSGENITSRLSSRRAHRQDASVLVPVRVDHLESGLGIRVTTPLPRASIKTRRDPISTKAKPIAALYSSEAAASSSVAVRSEGISAAFAGAFSI